MSTDDEQLNMLSIFHYVLGGLGCVFSLFPIFHVVIGLIIVFEGDAMFGKGEQAPPPFFGWFFVIMGSFFIVFGILTSLCLIFSGRFLARREKYMFSFVVACVACMMFPLGTALGVFTIVVLSRDSAKKQYGIGADPGENGIDTQPSMANDPRVDSDSI